MSVDFTDIDQNRGMMFWCLTKYEGILFGFPISLFMLRLMIDLLQLHEEHPISVTLWSWTPEDSIPLYSHFMESKRCHFKYSWSYRRKRLLQTQTALPQDNNRWWHFGLLCYVVSHPLGSEIELKDSKPISTITPTTPVPTHDHITHLILDQKSATQALQTFRWASNHPHFTHYQSTYRAVIHKLCCFRRFNTVHQLLDEMPSTIGSKPDEVILITIVRGLRRARMVRQIVRVLDLVSKLDEKPTLKLCNSILDVLVKEDIGIAREFYRKKMVGCYGLQGDEYTFKILMKGLCLTNRINEAFKLLQAMTDSLGATPNTVVDNTLIHALCKNRKLGIGRARSLLNEMVAPNDVTFNVLITAYCREDNLVQAILVDAVCTEGKVGSAIKFLDDMVGRCCPTDSGSYSPLLCALCRKGDFHKAKMIVMQMVERGNVADYFSWNDLVTCLKGETIWLEGNICDSRDMKSKIGERVFDKRFTRNILLFYKND